jgi:1,4-dihydroxy-2-naphthoyl-CoA hydrolase
MTKEPEQLVPFDQDLNAALGMSVDLVEDGLARGSFNVEDRVRQPFGIVHGGAYAALAETLASIGTFHVVMNDGMLAMGMSNNTTFLRPVSSGSVSGEAVVLHRGRTTWVWDVTFSDDVGQRCAVSRVTIAVREPRS